MPTRLGRYVVQRRIGSGGFATVWLAYDEQLDSPVAVKVLAENWTEDAHIRRRFQEEGRYLRRVESPHVVTVYDAGELDDGRPYLVMTFADQGTLADRLDGTGEGEGGLSTPQSLEVVRQIASGLQALHDRDILHRDVKPANVLFRTVSSPAGGSQDVRAMLGDLGLGKALDVSSRLTMIAGTPSYVAPEQAAAEPIDARADQYSLAAVAYLLLAGRPPFAHANLKAAADPGVLPPMSTPEKPFADEVEDVVRRGLARDPGDRYPSVTDFATALGGAMAATTGELPATSSPGRPWLPIDSALTQVGHRPTAVPRPPGRVRRPLYADEVGATMPASYAALPTEQPSREERTAAPTDSTAPAQPRRRSRGPVIAAVVMLALAVGVAGVVGGSELRRRDTSVAAPPATRQLVDESGELGVTVPAGWSAQSLDGWEWPTQGHHAAISAGTSADWAQHGGEGVFVGLVSATKLPSVVPKHPECAKAGEQQTLSSTAVQRSFSGCPGGVVIERVEQVTTSLLLWVQVSAPTRVEAGTVLDTVRTIGL